MPHDIFISYRRGDSNWVNPLVDALERRGLSVWIDRNKIEDGAEVTKSIREGLSDSKALVTWFSDRYPFSRPCQWELTAAFITAQKEGDPRKRVLIINPEKSPDHIYLPELKDQQYFNAPIPGDEKGYELIADRIARQISALKGTLGQILMLVGPVWYPDQAIGSLRFVGRLKEMWVIHRGLWEGQIVIDRLGHPGVVRLVGMGGTGKSLLAEEYALRFGAAYSGGIFHLIMPSASSEPDSTPSIQNALDSQYRSIASFLGIDIKDKHFDMIRGELRSHFEKQGKPFLWIVDDVPADVSVSELKKGYAPHPLGKTLMTTRSGEYTGIGNEVKIDKIEPEAARELLTKRRPPRDDAEKAVIPAILHALGYHALAVDVAGARLESASYVSFLRQLESPGKDALELAAQFAGQLPNGHETSIAKTLIESIERLDEEALDFLRLAASLQPYRIPAALVAGAFQVADGLDEDEAKDRADLAIHNVSQQSLAESVRDENFSVTVHALVSRTVRFTDTSRDRMAALRKGAIDTLNRVLPAVDDIRNHARLEPWVAHARHLSETPETPEETDLLGWIGHFEYRRGAYSQAAMLLKKQLEICKRVLGEEHPDTLTSMNNLANTLWAQGDHAGARALEEKVLEVMKRVLGEEHPDTLTSMGNLASTLRAQGDHAGARALHEKVLEVRKRVLGEEHPDTTISAWNLLTTLLDIGDQEAAISVVQESLLWLLNADPNNMGGDQQTIRGYLEKMVNEE